MDVGLGPRPRRQAVPAPRSSTMLVACETCLAQGCRTFTIGVCRALKARGEVAATTAKRRQRRDRAIADRRTGTARESPQPLITPTTGPTDEVVLTGAAGRLFGPVSSADFR